jgi:amino acid transporter
MARIFFILASLSIILLVAVMVIGLSMDNLYAQPAPSKETLLWASRHRLAGIAAAIGVIFVECIGYTYFVGTSRWCKEVVETYRLDPAAVVASNRLKRRTFPWALAGMLTVVGIAALGAASDPATLQPKTQAWADWHLVGAFLGIVLIAWTYVVLWNNIVANQAINERVVDEVSRFRKAAGLDARTESAG